MLARNGRFSFRSISVAIGLTTKSVKSRVDKMLSYGVIDRFITVINPSIFGYSGTYVIALRKSKLNKELLERINLVGVIGYQFEVLGGVIGLGIGVKEEDEDKIQMLLDSLRPAIVGLIESRNHEVPNNSYQDRLCHNKRTHQETEDRSSRYRKGDFNLPQNNQKKDGEDDEKPCA